MFLLHSVSTDVTFLLHHIQITSVRNDLVKISKARYTFACRYIRDALLSAYRS